MSRSKLRRERGGAREVEGAVHMAALPLERPKNHLQMIPPPQLGAPLDAPLRPDQMQTDKVSSSFPLSLNMCIYIYMYQFAFFGFTVPVC